MLLTQPDAGVRVLAVEQSLQGDLGHEDASPYPEARNLATAHGVVCGRTGDAKYDRCFFDGHGQALFWSVLDDRPDSATVNVQLFSAQDGFGFTERIGVLVPPVELCDLDHADGDAALQLW